MHEPPRPRGASAIWTTIACFALGTAIGAAALWGLPRPVSGEGSWGLPAAMISGALGAAAFVVSTFVHRRGETVPMPRWQAIVSGLATVALTIAFASVTALGVLLAGEVLAVGMQGLELSALGGGLLIGVASAVGGRFAFGAGVGLRTGDLAELLLVYLLVGTIFAMLTAADPRWWENNFSVLGTGVGAWAFNGTVFVAGLLIATVGAYIGRDLHRLLGDAALGRIAGVVGLWAGSGIALAAVGLIPVHRAPFVHNLAAFAAIGLFLLAGIVTVLVMPGPPRTLLISTTALIVLLAAAFVLSEVFRLYTVTALEVIIVGLGLTWMLLLVRTLETVAPQDSRPSTRESLLHE